MKKLVVLLFVILSLLPLSATASFTLGLGASAYTDSSSMRFLPGGYLEGGAYVDITKSGNLKFDSVFRLESGVDAKKNDYILLRPSLGIGLLYKTQPSLTFAFRPTASWVMFISNLKDHQSILDLAFGASIDFGVDLAKDGLFLIYTGLDVEYGFFERNIYYDISLGIKYSV